MRTILIIDDDLFTREIYGELVSLHCEKVITAENGLIGLETFKTVEDIDLIILDWIMPVMDGIECYIELRKISKNIPIVFMSGQRMDKLKFDIVRDKHLYMYQKPLMIEKLQMLFNKKEL